jgi:hypothetical protein
MQWVCRGSDQISVKPIVVTTIFEFLANSPANFKRKSGRDGQVSAIKQSMKVSPHKQSILHPVLAVRGKRLDVSCVQSRECALIRYGTPPTV